MSNLNGLVFAVCLVSSSLFHASAGAANDRSTGQIIGLCSQGGLGGIVLEEVLKTEGISYVQLHDLGQLDKSGLRGLILDEGFDDAVPEIERFLEKGGVLLTLKPSGSLAKTLGLEQVGDQKGGYMSVGARGNTIVSYQGRLQLFGTSNRYRGGENVAAFSGDGGFGGIVQTKRGLGTGLAVAFDLPATLLTLLQPTSECGKAIDASNVEYELIDVPQVDLMRRLVVGLFLEALDVPLARTWYFPSQRPAMLVVLGDQDGANFEQMKAVLGMMKELETPYTLYVTPTDQPITKEQFKTLADDGMEFAFHPDLTANGTFTEEEFQAQWKRAVADVGCPLTGERTHASRWESFHQTPTWAERTGLQYDAILGVRVWESKRSKNGYVLGTGLPYRFVDPNGPMRLDFLEIPTIGIDNTDFWKPRKYTVNYSPNAPKTFWAGLGLTEDEALDAWKQILDRAIDKHHTAIGYCWHPRYLVAKTLKQSVPFTSDTHFRKCINYAKGRGAGLIGTNALNEFWRAREKVVFSDVVWKPESATFKYTISSPVRVNSLTLIAPFSFHGKKAHVSVNGQPNRYSEVDLLGGRQAMWTIDVGPRELLVTVRYD